MRYQHFKDLPLNSPELFPENLLDRIGADHPARLISSVVDKLDLSGLIQGYKGGGTSAYHPRMLLKVLFYGYFMNIYSSRKLAQALKENLAFIFLAGDSQPDHRTLNRFRGERLKDEIKGLFAEIVKLLVSESYVTLETQYVDGTKIEANSNRYQFVWGKRVSKDKTKLETKISGILAEIESNIALDKAEEEPESTQTGAVGITSETLSARIEALNEQLNTSLSASGEKTKSQRKVSTQLRKLASESLPKLAEYEEKQTILGERNSYSKTDEDATFMRLKDDHMKNGQLKAAYNIQASAENQFITHFSIHQCPGDTSTLKSHLDGFEASYGKQSKVVVADAGYGSEENYEMLSKKGIDAYVKYPTFHQEQQKAYQNDLSKSANWHYNEAQDFVVCPMGQRMPKIGQATRKTDNGYEATIKRYQAQNCEGCPLRGVCHNAKGNRIVERNPNLNKHRQIMREKLHSETGIAYTKKRSVEIEPVFGQIKADNLFNRFSLRGLDKVNTEFALIAIAHNLRKKRNIDNNNRKKQPKIA
ncbi:MAG: IS1182 family transposase [Bacteroidales bacterium]